jgi:hypothetical protein
LVIIPNVSLIIITLLLKTMGHQSNKYRESPLYPHKTNEVPNTIALPM